jgi:RimJ/RimL family protein N-acetyltransferase
MQVPRIETQRLFLQALETEDAQAMYAYRSDAAVSRYQSWRPTGEAAVRESIQKIHETGFNVVNTWFQLGIYLKSSKELIGDLGVHFIPPDNRQTEIGFTVSPTYQRQGYAGEAVRALILYLFRTLHKHRITASVDPRNSASIALLEKLGMRREAHFRKSIWLDDGWGDDVIYAVLQEEWR